MRSRMVRSAISATVCDRIQLTGTLLSAAIGLCVAGSAWAQSGISQYPYCIQGVDNPGWSGCSFNTLQACQAAASGTEAECLSNPWYKAGQNATPPSQQMPIGAGNPLPVGPPPN
jgi:Protein of unknown function (DUF3551)